MLTSKHKKYWEGRRIDWKAHYTDTWSHPHREIIISALRSFPWLSLWEVGCASGPNLIRIVKEFPNKMLGGSDVSEDAIAEARKTFTNGRFRVESVEDLLLTDKSTDVLLSDATLIYVDPFKIKGVLRELKRVTRNNLVLCEYHSDNLWKRWLYRLKTGYNAYDYRKLLEGLGAYDIQMVKIPPHMWPGTKPGDGWYEFGTVIACKLPK